MKQAVLRVNCAYPGAWAGEMQRMEGTGDAPITVAHVYASGTVPGYRPFPRKKSASIPGPT